MDGLSPPVVTFVGVVETVEKGEANFRSQSERESNWQFSAYCSRADNGELKISSIVYFSGSS